MKKKRWILIGGGAVALLAAGWSFMRGSALTVEIGDVVRDSLTVVVAEEGRSRLHDEYGIAAPTTGLVSRIDLVAGDSVREGQEVARMSPPPSDPRTTRSAQADLAIAHAQTREAEAALESARQARDQAVREYERRVPLFDLGALSREALERAEQDANRASAALTRSEAGLVAAESSVEAARARLMGVSSGDGAATQLIRSPVTGVVLRVHEKSERVVQAGAPLLEISGPEGLEFVTDLLTEEAVRVSPGDSVRVTGWGGDRSIEGRVRYIEPAAFTEVSALGVEEQRVNVVGDLFSTPPSLGAGFRLDVSIVVWSGSDVLVVPASAVFRRPSGWHLFRVEDGVARLRPIEIGQQGTDRVEIVSGLTEGDQVVLFPSDQIDDGVAVKAAPDEGG